MVTCRLETKDKAIANQLSRKTRLFVKARIAMAIVGSLERRGRDFKDLKDFRDCRVFRVFRDSRDFKDLRVFKVLKALKVFIFGISGFVV